MLALLSRAAGAGIVAAGLGRRDCLHGIRLRLARMSAGRMEALDRVRQFGHRTVLERIDLHAVEIAFVVGDCDQRQQAPPRIGPFAISGRGVPRIRTQRDRIGKAVYAKFRQNVTIPLVDVEALGDVEPSRHLTHRDARHRRLGDHRRLLRLAIGPQALHPGDDFHPTHLLASSGLQKENTTGLTSTAAPNVVTRGSRDAYLYAII